MLIPRMILLVDTACISYFSPTHLNNNKYLEGIIYYLQAVLIPTNTAKVSDYMLFQPKLRGV